MIPERERSREIHTRLLDLYNFAVDEFGVVHFFDGLHSGLVGLKPDESEEFSVQVGFIKASDLT